MKRVFFTLLCFIALIANSKETGTQKNYDVSDYDLPFISTNKHLDIYPIKSQIIIDGSGGDSAWDYITFNSMDQNKGEPNYKNNTAKFKMTYDNDYIYVFVSVFDSQLDTSQSKNVWEKDCIDLIFSMDTTSNIHPGNGQAGFFQLRKIFGRAMTDYTSKGFLAYEEETVYGRNQEWRLPIDSLASTLTDKTKWNKKDFRFECINSDNDGAGRLSQLFWNSIDEDNIGTLRFRGYVSLKTYNSNVKWLDYNSISIKDNYVQFSENTDYTLYNVAGVILRKGSNSSGFSISDLKKGIYIISTEKGHVKISK